MQWLQDVPFYLLVGSMLVCYLAYYSYRYRYTPGGRYFWILMVFSSLIMLFSAFELLSTTFEMKLLWRNMQQISLFFGGLFSYAFVRDYVSRTPQGLRRHLTMLSIPFILYAFLIFTDPIHHLMRSDVDLHYVGHFTEIKVQPTVLNVLFIAYSQVLTLSAFVILVLNLRYTCKRLYRQHLILLIAIGFPIVFIFLIPFFDVVIPAPMSLSVLMSALLFFYGLFNYQLFSIWPIAKDRIFENMKEAIVVLDRYDTILDMNPSGEKILSRVSTDHIAPKIGDPIYPYIENNQALLTFYRKKQESTIDIKQTAHYYRVALIPLGNIGKKTSEILLMFTDMTETKKIEQTLFLLATRDELTNVCNRRYFIKKFYEYLEDSNGKNGHLALLILDIDNFKFINDQYGHIVGDQVLMEFAKVLKNSSRSEDLVGRIGGEEFGVFLTAVDNRKESYFIAERLRRSIENVQIKLNEETDLTITASIGIGYAEISDEITFEELYHQADMALLQSKKTGKNKVTLQ